MLTTAALDETSRSAWHRKNGVYPQEPAAWWDAAIRQLDARCVYFEVAVALEDVQVPISLDDGIVHTR
ncbi:MAG: hypothetical protein VB142_04485 [Burkholderia sp.]